MKLDRQKMAEAWRTSKHSRQHAVNPLNGQRLRDFLDDYKSGRLGEASPEGERKLFSLRSARMYGNYLDGKNFVERANAEAIHHALGYEFGNLLAADSPPEALGMTPPDAVGFEYGTLLAAGSPPEGFDIAPPDAVLKPELPSAWINGAHVGIMLVAYVLGVTLTDAIVAEITGYVPDRGPSVPSLVYMVLIAMTALASSISLGWKDIASTGRAIGIGTAIWAMQISANLLINDGYWSDMQESDLNFLQRVVTLVWDTAQETIKFVVLIAGASAVFMLYELCDEGQANGKTMSKLAWGILCAAVLWMDLSPI